jgi:carboxypeptidase-like protein
MQNQNHLTALLVGFIFCISVFLPSVLSAQTHTITGRVVDAQTGEPLAYATVGLKNEPIGTVTNLAGHFDFHIPEKFFDGQIVFSTLGYLDHTINVKDAAKGELQIISLEPGHILLDEVLVTEQLGAETILQIAINKIEKNYPMAPVDMDGFYRETKMVDGEYVALLEAAVKIYDKDYKAPRDQSRLRERVSLIEVRRTYDLDNSLNKYFNKYNVMEDLLLENSVKYRTFDNQKEFYPKLRRKVVVGYNNQPINLVYAEEPGYFLKIYIDNNYGIRKIVLEWGDGVVPIFAYRKSHKLENRVMRLVKQIEFQQFGDKLYLRYIAASYQNNWANRKTGDLELVVRRDQALLINKLNYTNPKWIKNSKKMKRYGLQFQHEAYNEEFWASYNTIKDMPLDDKAQFDLEKLFSLEEQFESFEHD